MFSIPTAVVLKGMLVFLRVSGILFAMPIFGDKLTPVRVRILLSVALAYIIYPVVPESWSSSLPRCHSLCYSRNKRIANRYNSWLLCKASL